MNLPPTEKDNKHVIVFQNLLSKWPFGFPIPDQKAVRVAQLIEIMTIFGVPEALLSDRGNNFLSSLGLDLCKLWVLRNSTQQPTTLSVMGWSNTLIGPQGNVEKACCQVW